MKLSVKEQNRSLILVTVDCLRADHCGFNGYSFPTTPFLDRLAGESFIVPTAVVAGTPTYFSFPAILASRMPLALGRDVVGLAPGESTLATALCDAGYATAAFSAANPYISAHFGYDQGFEVFKDFLDYPVPAVARAADQRFFEASTARSGTRGTLNQSLKICARVLGLDHLYDELYFQYCLRVAARPVSGIDSLRKFPSAEEIVDHAILWLTSVKSRPFFLWMHLMDPHSPYYPDSRAFRELTGRNASATRARYLNEFWNRTDLRADQLEPKKRSVMELYDAGIRSVDNQIARFVAHLKEADLWDVCAFVLTADHGEEFLDHGKRYHAPLSLFEEIAHVPLVMRIPSTEKKKVTTTPFSHLHLAPTLLDILDVRAPESFQGMSLWPNLQHGTTWNELAITECVSGCTNPFREQSRLAPRLLSVRNSRYKLTMQIESGSTESIYDLEADPKENMPLTVDIEKQIRANLLHGARNHLQKASTNRDGTVRLKGRLRDLRVELETLSH